MLEFKLLLENIHAAHTIFDFVQYAQSAQCCTVMECVQIHIEIHDEAEDHIWKICGKSPFNGR